jgi:hypothetical protein
MIRRPKPRKLLCPPCPFLANNYEMNALSKQITTVGCSCSCVGESVIKSLRHLWRQVGGRLFSSFLDSSFIAMMNVHSVAASSHPSRCEGGEQAQRWHTGLGRRGGGNGNNNNKKKAGGNQLLARVPTYRCCYSGRWGPWGPKRRQTPSSAIQQR